MLSVGGSHSACNEATSCVSNQGRAGLNALWQATERNNKPRGGGRKEGGSKVGLKYYFLWLVEQHDVVIPWYREDGCSHRARSHLLLIRFQSRLQNAGVLVI